MSSKPASRIRILLLIPHLGIGGAQRVVAALARHLDSDKYELHLALLTQSASDLPQLPPSIRIHCLGAGRARSAAWRLLALAWRVRPRLVFAGMAHLAPLVLLLRVMLPGRTCIIIRQNGVLSSQLAAMRPRLLSRPILTAAYKKTDAIICQTQTTADDLQREFDLDKTRIHVLPNPLDIEKIQQAASCPPPKPDPYLLAVGRLAPEKGFDLLLDALAELQRDFPTPRLLIAGSGRCRASLEFQSRLIGLAGMVEFLGDVSDPSQYFSNALAFVLSSRQDELPNALLEAAAAGLPIIATPASPGVSTLLTGQPWVWLARETSIDALASALRAALTAVRPRQRVTHDWTRPFALAQAIAAYERVFEQAMNRNRP